MAHNNYNNFWDFVRGYGHEGTGVDHIPRPGGAPCPPPSYRGFPFVPFAGPPMFGGFPHPHETSRHAGNEQGSGCGLGDSQNHAADPTQPDDGIPESERRRHRGPRGPCARNRHHGPRGPHPHPPNSFSSAGGFDMNAVLGPLSTHPLMQAFRDWAGAATAGPNVGANTEEQDSEDSFVPPVDIFSTDTQYILHVAIPGAKKEDVGVNWDTEKGELSLAGVVYRQGDEEFLKTLSKSERKVGVFERSVKLPPGIGDEKVEVDSDAISAKLEDGVLVVTIPKVEKEWTEVKRVDIE